MFAFKVHLVYLNSPSAGDPHETPYSSFTYGTEKTGSGEEPM